MTNLRIGHGWDRHRLVKGRPLVIGGITIDSPVGPKAHSDGDVLIHAIIDAICGAIGHGNIGEFFPSSDPTYKNANSEKLLQLTIKVLCEENNFTIVNIDTTVILEEPKLSPYVEDIKVNIATICNIPYKNINVKPKTGEGIDGTGNKLAIEAHAVVLLEKN